MCLILIAIDSHPDYPQLILANRDEFYARPTRPLHRWAGSAGLWAGADLRSGGSWMGVTEQGRVAAVTNIRTPTHMRREGRSRGELVVTYLQGSQSAEAYLDELRTRRQAYPGFNLLVGDARGLWALHSDTGEQTPLSPGVHGLSNARLDTPWPKLTQGAQALSRCLQVDDPAIQPEALLAIMQDATPAPDELLPDTGVPRDWERALSARFIRHGDYGTRSTTLWMRHRDGRQLLWEQSWGEQGEALGTPQQVVL